VGSADWGACAPGPAYWGLWAPGPNWLPAPAYHTGNVASITRRRPELA
jgi:hypothetical protein